MCATERSNPKADVGQILKLYLKYFSSYKHFSTLKHKKGVNDKVRTDLDLHNWSNSEMGIYVIERSYPKVGVGEI